MPDSAPPLQERVTLVELMVADVIERCPDAIATLHETMVCVRVRVRACVRACVRDVQVCKWLRVWVSVPRSWFYVSVCR